MARQTLSDTFGEWKPQIIEGAKFITPTLAVVVYGSYRIYTAWRYRLFQNVIHFNKTHIERTAANKYRVNLRMLMEKPINHVIASEGGIRRLHKYAHKKHKEDSNASMIVHLDGTKDWVPRSQAMDHWMIYSGITNQLSSLSAPMWLSKRYENASTLNPDNFYITSILGYNLNEKNEAMHKIRVYCIKEQLMNQLLGDLKHDYLYAADDIWESLLEDVDMLHGATINHWRIIRDILRKYDTHPKRDDGTIKWGQPLCRIELYDMLDGDSNISGDMPKDTFTTWPSKKDDCMQ